MNSKPNEAELKDLARQLRDAIVRHDLAKAARLLNLLDGDDRATAGQLVQAGQAEHAA